MARKKNKRKKTKKRPQQPISYGKRPSLNKAARWPIHEILLTKNWQKTGEIIQILVSRRSALNQYLSAVFLVDLGALGIKNAYHTFLDGELDYKLSVRRQLTSTQPMIHADLDLVAKIIYEAAAYARQLGFVPTPDYREAKRVLANANPDACDVEVPLGKDGKPFFVAGPYDDVDGIMKHLMRTFGPDGFHYVISTGPDMEEFHVSD